MWIALPLLVFQKNRKILIMFILRYYRVLYYKKIILEWMKKNDVETFPMGIHSMECLI